MPEYRLIPTLHQPASSPKDKLTIQAVNEIKIASDNIRQTIWARVMPIDRMMPICQLRALTEATTALATASDVMANVTNGR